MSKKLLAILLCMVLALAAFPFGVFAENENNDRQVTFSAEVGYEDGADAVYKDGSAHTVTVNVKPNKTITVDNVYAYFTYPEDWSVAVTNDVLGFSSASNVTTGLDCSETGRKACLVGWYGVNPNPPTPDGTSYPIDSLMTITFTVPADVALGDYEFEVGGDEAGYGIELGDEEGNWEDGATVPFTVSVKKIDVPVESVTISGDNEVEVGDTLQLTATVLPNTADDTTVSWSSSDTTKATVDENGVVTGVAPGTVTITATTNGKNAAGQSETANKTITVYKLVEKPTPNTGLVYDGTEKTGVDDPAANAGYTVTGNKQTNAGSYTAVATLDEGCRWMDSTTGSLEIPWSIAKAVIEVPEANTGLVYDGTEKTGVDDPAANAGYTVTGNKQTNAGDYKATVTPDANHRFSDDAASKEVPWSIAKAVIEVPEANTGLVYDGTEKTGVDDPAANAGYTVTGNKQTEAGDYKATVTPDANHRFSDDATSKKVSWSIDRAGIDVPTANSPAPVYDGTQKTGVDAGNYYTIKENTGTNAGNYTAKATPDSNHKWNGETGDAATATKEIPWSIARQQVAVPAAETGLVYDGTTKTGVPAGEKYDISGNTGTDAKNDYEATASLKDKDNYEWATSPATTDDQKITWAIAQAELKEDSMEITVGGTGKVPAGDDISYEVEPEGVIELDENGNVTGVAEGEAKIIVAASGNGNYERGQVTITVTVVQPAPTPTGDTTMRWVAVGTLALVIMVAYLFISKRKENE